MGNITIDRGVWSGLKTVDCYAAQDQQLSAEARALMWYLLSKPDDWDMRLEDVQKEFGWGDFAWRRIRDNLMGNGYLEGESIPGHGYRWSFRSRPEDARPNAESLVPLATRGTGNQRS